MIYKVAIVGLGYWGPNLLRTFVNFPDCEVVYCCDLKKESLKEVSRRYPFIKTTTDFKEVINDPDVDAVILATTTKTHFSLAKMALKSGKDVLVEKPLARNSKEAWELVSIADKYKRVLMVDNILLFNPAVLKIKELIDQGEIGKILYIDSIRTNLGLIQKDINVIFDLASHEFSVIQFILKNMPKIVSITGRSHISKQIDVAYITAEYPNNILAHVHITWLSPVKVRRMLIVGSKKMIVYDDNDPSEKVRVYDKGITKEKSPDNQRQVKINYRVGDVWSPNLEISDPLTNLAKGFIGAIETRKVTRSDGRLGAEIVEILESATKLYAK